MLAVANSGSCRAFALLGRGERRASCFSSENPLLTERSRCRWGHQVMLGLRSKRFATKRGVIVRVRAAWMLKGNSREEMEPGSERSEAANDDLMVFFFQLDMQTRIQCALNMEQFDVAQELRNKLNEVEKEITKQWEARRGSSSKSEVQDKSLKILHLRSDLQKAIDKERYTLAAKIRDDISKLEAESLDASARALVLENLQYLFRLGQKVIHNTFGYHGVICGMDPVCCESIAWMEGAHVDKLSRGPNQPFYQVLVDVYADPNLLVTYVAEEKLSENKQKNMDGFNHPYLSFLFYGVDAAGDFIPVKQLRDKYTL